MAVSVVSSTAPTSGLIGSPLLRPVRLLAPLDGSGRVFSQPRGLLHPCFQRVSSPFSLLNITDGSLWNFLSVELSPTGIAASFAAADSTVQIFTQRVPQPLLPAQFQEWANRRRTRDGDRGILESNRNPYQSGWRICSRMFSRNQEHEYASSRGAFQRYQRFRIAKRRQATMGVCRLPREKIFPQGCNKLAIFSFPRSCQP